MNQTRLFLIFAWLMVATLLWMEWGKEKQTAQAPATPVAQVAVPPTATSWEPAKALRRRPCSLKTARTCLITCSRGAFGNCSKSRTAPSGMLQDLRPESTSRLPPPMSTTTRRGGSG